MKRKQAMKKITTISLLILLLFFSALPLCSSYQKALKKYPPFLTQSEKHFKKKTIYTGTDFSIEKEAKLPEGMHAKAYCLYDATTERCLLGKNENEKLPMASTTKIMTCILALEKGNLSDKVTFSAYAASMPDVQLNAGKGDTFYLKDLLYSLMLESHNDTAVAIAEHIGGSVEGFAALMNEKCISLGLKNTSFVTPNGLDADGHFTTAAELCKIAAYAIKNKEFLHIIKTPSHSFSDCSGKKSYHANSHNLFLTGYQGAIGIKTGYTGKAGYCFCGAAKRNHTTLITSVLASGFPPHKTYKWTDTRKLMDYGFENFQTVTLSPAPVPELLSIYQAQKNTLDITCRLPEKLSFTLSKNDTLTHATELPSHLNAPVRKGDIIGFEKYYLDDTLLYQFPVIAGETITVRDYHYYKNLLKKLLLTAL